MQRLINVSRICLHNSLLKILNKIKKNKHTTTLKTENDLCNHYKVEIPMGINRLMSFAWLLGGSLVKGLTQDQRAAGSSLTGFTAFCH